MAEKNTADIGFEKQIWNAACVLRGNMDASEYKGVVLGLIFLKYISDRFEDKYNQLVADGDGFEEDRDEYTSEGIFFVPAGARWSDVSAKAHDPEIGQVIDDAMRAIEKENARLKDILPKNFARPELDKRRLGEVVDLFTNIKMIEHGSEKDILGRTYEYCLSMFAEQEGKRGGEFFTPQHVSKLIAQLAMHGQTHVNKIYDPAAGSGSLLLQAKKQFEEHKIEDGFFGQEINHTTYNLARMNMFLHNINYDKFNIKLGDTLTNPHFKDDRPFDAIVSNPPYSINWIGSDDPTLINDERFAPAGVLAPKSKADFAFILHSLNYLSSKGRAAIVCFPGIFYRGGAEQKIRKYLVDNNYVETVISLAPNLFYGTSIAVNILVLSKHKEDTKIQFIEAGELYQKETNNNILTDEHIEKIIEAFDSKNDVQYFAKSTELEEIAKNDYNLSVSSYVEAKDTREKIDIKALNSQISEIVARENTLRAEIDKIVEEIEGRIND